MAVKLILLDTSILIDYYRKADKSSAVWLSLIKQGHDFAVSAITKYEIYSGATQAQMDFWSSTLEAITILPFDGGCVDVAVTINAELKKKRKQIGIADLFIGATAVAHGLPLATLNKKHFERIADLALTE